jgi:Zn-dependent peptidase ImmA (M78 family)
LVARREALGLPSSIVAREARLTLEQLSALEKDQVPPSSSEVESLARILAVEAELLMDGQTPAAAADPLRMLLKSAEDFKLGPDLKFRMIQAAAAANDLLDLREEFDAGSRPFQQFQVAPHAPNKTAFDDGASLARKVRTKLKLPDAVPSIRDVVLGLGIPIVAADLSEAGPDAFTIFRPPRRVAIVVNVTGKNSNPLVRRFSLAHDLCHALFDRPAQAPFGVACRQEVTERDLYGESRANAFAGRLLLPERRLGELGKSVLREDVFRKTMETYGIHLMALRLYVKKVLKLSDADALSLLPSVDSSPPLLIRDAEELPAERQATLCRIPLSRRGELAHLVAKFLSVEKLSRGRALELLRVPESFDLGEFVAFFGYSLPQR